MEITGGTINDAVNGLNFSTVEVVGADNDYTLNRELGTIELETLLVANDQITSSSLNTRAFYELVTQKTMLLQQDKLS